MRAALLITAIFIVVFWLIFFQFKLIKLTIAWAVVSSLFLLHLLECERRGRSAPRNL